MRVALLSSTLGFGHLRAAQAVAEALLERDRSLAIEFVDVWSLMDESVAAAAREGYLRAVTEQPQQYENLFRYSDAQWRNFFRSPSLEPELSSIIHESVERWFPGRNGFPTRGANLDQTLFLNLFQSITVKSPIKGNLVRRGLVVWMHALLCRRLKQRLAKFSPDVVISTQMMPAALLSALKRRGEFTDVPAMGVITDYGVHHFWLRSNIDHYCVATDTMAAELRMRGITEAAIAVTGIPLMAGFRQPPTQSEARRRLGIHASRPTVLITGGGYGIGAADALAAMLASGAPDCQILLAAGQHVQHARLKRFAAERPQDVFLFQHDVNMPLLLRAADIVIGKPGGLSVSEALACGRPFLAICSLGGQESFNVAHVEQQGVGERIDVGQLPAALKRWFGDPMRLAGIQAKAASVGARQGAALIAGTVMRLHGVGSDKHEEHL
jgi:processive 1,2-diacylglycerol beta-glucosyltransferase